MTNPSNKKNLEGQRFGMWTVTGPSTSTTPKGKLVWPVRCDCGTEKELVGENLTRGKSNSCGCMSKHFQSVNLVTHGHTRFGGRMTGTYRSWHAMRQRCLNENHKQYADYGGRGIGICERWSTFENFLADMGERPDGLTLDRHPDVDGNYQPGNCRWATPKEQTANRRAKVKNSDMLSLVGAVRLVVAANDNDLKATVDNLRVALVDFDNRRVA